MVITIDSITPEEEERFKNLQEIEHYLPGQALKKIEMERRLAVPKAEATQTPLIEKLNGKLSLVEKPSTIDTLRENWQWSAIGLMGAGLGIYYLYARSKTV